ncbi:MAG TPA: PLDc N-terminal domain-containing protein [Luteolibacter sp.]|nr:PLDc N-terminal domain-containing protein [Luteolibacter sp.]
MISKLESMKSNALHWMLSFALLLPSVAMAQTQPSDEEAAAACATCAGMGGFMIFIVIAAIVLTIALNIALLVWVARDAKSRGMDSSVLWMFLVMFTSLLGLMIYLFSRPQGNLLQCPSCKNKRLVASAKCPHCGNP